MFIEVNGANLFVNSAGNENKKTIVVLHGGRGIGDHSGDFKAFFPLAEKYRIIAYDQRGCGRSSLTKPFSFEQLTDDVEGVRQRLNLGKIILCGGSFGGMIALKYAIKYQKNLSHLILRGTAPSYHHEEEALQNCIERLDKATSGSVNMCKKLFNDEVIDDVELRLIWLALQPLYYEKFDPDASLEKTRKMYFHAETHNDLFAKKDYDVRNQLKEIRVPTLITVGKNDWICPVSQSDYMHKKISKSWLQVFEKSNHSPQIEENKEFLKLVNDFIENTEAYINV